MEENKIYDALDRLLEIGGSERSAQLAELETADPKLYREVIELLSLEEEAAKLIGDSVAEHLTTELASFEADLADALVDGDVVGPYRIIRQIGRGGMGSVYLAHRDDIDRDVALKVIRRGMDTADVLSRFDAERRILAGLNHPNIAGLFDSGATQEGLPYFVMEYVDGLPIDQYCDEHRLNVTERLKLFEDVCGAVHYAHQALVVHRDLKPSNMLVDAEGTVKLLDFGIAKALDNDGSDPSTRIQGVRRALTPAYAAPEQFGVGAITTSSDVYTLGVLLYELLTGRRPLKIEQKLDVEAARIVLEDEPTRPSTVVENSTLEVDAEHASIARRSTIDRLKRRLSGDLDNIVLKALRKEPSERYSSAEQLVADIGRHLTGQPVIARKPTAGYRIKKFVGRHHFGVGVAGAVLAMITMFIVLLINQNAETARERDRARMEAEKSAQVAAFVQGMFEVADPDAALGDTLRVRTVLQQAATRIQHDLTEQPEIRAALMTVVGRVYAKLAMYEAALPMLEEALDVRRTVYGTTSLEAAETQADLGGLYIDRAEYESADSLLKNALGITRELNDDEPKVGTELLAADILRSLGSASELLGDFEESERYYREAIAIRRELTDENPLVLADYLSDLGNMLRKKTDFDASETVILEALAIYRSEHGADYAGSVVVEHNLAHLMQNKGDLTTADSIYRATVPKFKLLYGDNHPRVGTVYNNIAALAADMGNFAEADSVYRLAMDVYRSSLGEHHPYIPIVLNNIAFMYAMEGEYLQASEAFEDALALRRAALGDDHPDVGLAYYNLGRATHLLGDHQLATRQMETGLRIFEAKLEPDHLRTIRTRSGLGDCLTDQGRFGAAEIQLLSAYDASRKKLGAEDAMTKAVASRLVALYEAWNKDAAAEKYREPAAGSPTE